MAFAFRLLVAVAILVLAINAGFELFQRLGIETSKAANVLGMKDTSSAQTNEILLEGVLLGDDASRNFPVLVPDDIRIEYSFIQGEAEERPPSYRLLRAIMPVRAEIAKSPMNWRADFSGGGSFYSHARRSGDPGPKYLNGYPHWSCVSPTYSSILIYDYETKATTDIVPDGYAITSAVNYEPFGRSKTAEEGFLYGTFVTEDANKNNALNCNDPENLFVYRFSDGKFTEIDSGGQPFISAATFRGWGNSESPLLFSLGLDDNEDGVYDPFTEAVVPAKLDPASLTVTRLPIDG